MWSLLNRTGPCDAQYSHASPSLRLCACEEGLACGTHERTRMVDPLVVTPFSVVFQGAKRLQKVIMAANVDEQPLPVELHDERASEQTATVSHTEHAEEVLMSRRERDVRETYTCEYCNQYVLHSLFIALLLPFQSQIFPRSRPVLGAPTRRASDRMPNVHHLRQSTHLTQSIPQAQFKGSF